MIEITRIRIQILNGSNIVKQYKLKSTRVFKDKETLEDFRKLRELKLQWREDKRKHDVKVSVLFDTKEKSE